MPLRASDAAQAYQGDLAGAAAQFAEVVAEAEALTMGSLRRLASRVKASHWRYQGDAAAARAAADAAVEAAAELGGLRAGVAYWALAAAALAAGDAATAQDATEAAWPHLSALPQTAGLQRVCNAQAALAGGDLVAARRWADDAVRQRPAASCRTR